uniref:Glutathione S-transferase n=1 Tax=Phaedon brassicae TaxID=154011 RepID=A0A9Y1LQ49_9CUCU|nr:glutathione S-transferase [Phaedon brassicae]WET52793.1 glutathione S-transferase [Phaedon brassicae]
MAPPKLYSCLASPCARAVEMVAKAIGLELDVESFILVDGDYLRSDLPKLNPKHTVPTMDDNGFHLWDSHPIMIYLVEKYGKGSSIYPQDLQKRALVNQRLFFDSGDLFARHQAVMRPLMFGGADELTTRDIEFVAENYAIVEHFLEGLKFVAGNEVTIADISIWCSITNTSTYSPVDLAKFPNIKGWYKRMEALPYASINIEGGKAFGKLVADRLESLKKK